jgi:hypothetical protein
MQLTHFVAPHIGDVSVEEPKMQRVFECVYVLAPTAFRSQTFGPNYSEVNHQETEIWRACQRSGCPAVYIDSK